MRKIVVVLLASAAFWAQPSYGADALKFGPVPTWVIVQTIPNASAAPDASLAILLTDQQVHLEPGKTVTFSEVAMKVQRPEGLSAGNLSIPWDPAMDTVTVNTLEIRRGTQVIDVLASQKFTTMRRESALEAATLDGVLTANIQPEGLQEGDVIVLAMTTEHSDPVLGNHVELNFAQWPQVPIKHAHVHLEWPSRLKLISQARGVSVQTASHGNSKILDIDANDVQPIIAPKGAPDRYSITRLGEATDFTSWSEAAGLMEPLYRKASTIPAAGPLRDEVEKIRASTSDPKLRAQQALQLVQERVRYVALLMGQGGYVPADADVTWSRRFGDCKGKTALLLGILHALGIEAEPLLAQSRIGDAIHDRLPMISYFDHVLVRAHVQDKTYYLDGTRIGDTAIDDIQIPDFGWALPITSASQLVQLVPAPLEHPQSDTTIAIDASAGIYAPASVSADQVLRGDLAIEFNSGLTGLTETQRKEYFDGYWKKNIDDLTPGLSSFTFDRASRQLRMSMKGTVKLDWTGGFYHLPDTSIGYTPDLDRPDGPFHDAPYSVAHPIYTHTVTKLHFPPAYLPANVGKLVPEPVRTMLIGVEYSRTQSATTDSMTVETTTRSIVPEVAYKDALAASDKLKTLADGDVSVRLKSNYSATASDLPALRSDATQSADELVTRGNTLMNSRKFEDAIANFTKALTLDSKNVTALADRGIAYFWTGKIDLSDKDLYAATALDPDNAIVHRARALKAESAGDCATAVDAYTRSLVAEPGNAFALGHRALCENVLGRYSQALADADLSIKADPSWQQLRALRFDSLARLGQKDAAAHEAELIVKEDPQSAPASWIAIGKLYARAGLQAEAVAAFDRALALKADPSTYLARAHSRLSADVADRMADIEAALKLEPLDLEALSAKADLLVEQGDLKAALEIYDRAAKSLPSETALSVSRGIVLYKLGRTSEAERILSVWRKGALTATELNELCWRKAVSGIMLESALNDCNDALRINPNFTPAIDSLAFVNLRLGKLKDAVILYDRAVMKSQLSSSFMGRALAFERLGERDKAQADRAEALKRDAGIESRFRTYGLKFDGASETTTRPMKSN